MPVFSKAIRDLLVGDPFGEVFPPTTAPIPPVVDGRTVAMNTLKKYFQELVFYRSGGLDPNTKQPLPPIAFQVPERDIHVEWPDNPEDVHLPAIAFLSEERAKYDAIGMTTYVEEASRDVYAPGTILIWLYEFQENFVIELWAETKAQRRAMLAGIEQAMCPLQQQAGIRFRMPDYYGQLVCFEMNDREMVEDELAIRNRRRARLRVLVRFNVVALVSAVDFQSIVQLDVDVDEVSLEPVDIPDGTGEVDP